MPRVWVWVAAAILAGCGSIETLGVKETSPADGAANVSPTVEIRVTFTKEIDPATVTLQTLKLTDLQDRVLGGAVEAEAEVALFRPSIPLTAGARYRVHVLPEIQNLDEQPLAAAHTFEFTVTEGADVQPPVLLGTTPAANAQDVAPDTDLRAVFDEQLDPATVSFSSNVGEPITVTQGAQAVGVPSKRLPLATAVEVALAAGAKDLAGNALAAPLRWTFFTRDGVWNLEETLGATTYEVTQVVDRTDLHSLLAAHATGDRAAALWRDDTGRTQVTARGLDGAFLAPERIGTATARRASIAAHPGSDLIVTWQQDFPGRSGAAAFRRFDGVTGAWEPGWHFVTDVGSSLEPCAGVGPDRHAWVVWQQSDGGGWSTQGRRYTPDAGWSAPITLSSAPTALTEFGCAVSVESGGGATLYFPTMAGGNVRLVSRRHTEADGLGPEQVVSPFAEPRLGNVTATVGPDGTHHVLWQSGSSGTEDLTTDTVWYRRQVGGTWQSPEIVIHNGLAAPARFAFDGEGRPWVGWATGAPDATLRLSRREAGGWVEETVPTGELAPGATLSLGVDPRGNALLTFDRRGTAELYAVRFIRGLGWLAPGRINAGRPPRAGQHRTLVFADGSAASVRVAGTAAGDAVVFTKLQ